MQSDAAVFPVLLSQVHVLGRHQTGSWKWSILEAVRFRGDYYELLESNGRRLCKSEGFTINRSALCAIRLLYFR